MTCSSVANIALVLDTIARLPPSVPYHMVEWIIRNECYPYYGKLRSHTFHEQCKRISWQTRKPCGYPRLGKIAIYFLLYRPNLAYTQMKLDFRKLELVTLM